MDTIKKIQSYKSNPIQDFSGFMENPKAWIGKQSNLGKNSWLLAYADDGLIWGKVKDKELLLARDIYENSCPELIISTLQHLYLFGENAEIHIWREENTFKAYRLEDGPDVTTESQDQDLILWGTKIRQACSPEFTWMEDGSQGLCHPVPISVTAAKLDEEQLKRPLRLKVRQYLDYDCYGQVYIAAVRLVNVHEV